MDPVIEAIWDSDTHKLERALRVGADPNASHDGKSALQWACILEVGGCAKLLLNHGADPNSPDQAGSTALMAASFAGDLEVVKALLAGGAQADARDHDGTTALMGAAKAGHLAVIRALAGGSSDPRAIDARGRTALHWALAQADHAEAIELLLQLGADPTVMSKDGLCALDYADRLGRLRSRGLLQNVSQ